jgi:hypothetical protein
MGIFLKSDTWTASGGLQKKVLLKSEMTAPFSFVPTVLPVGQGVKVDNSDVDDPGPV